MLISTLRILDNTYLLPEETDVEALQTQFLEAVVYTSGLVHFDTVGSGTVTVLVTSITTAVFTTAEAPDTTSETGAVLDAGAVDWLNQSEIMDLSDTVPAQSTTWS